MLVAAAYASYGRYWYEFFDALSLSPRRLAAGTSYEGMEHLEVSASAGRGTIMALPHVGCFDFGGAWLSSIGYPATVVAEPVSPPELFEWFSSLRRRMGMEVLALDDMAGRSLLRALRSGGLVGLLSDRDVGGNGTEARFFGEITTLPAGPALLALRTGAALLPTAFYFLPNGAHHGVILPPVPAERSSAGLGHDVARVTQLLAVELERLISRAPAQWHVLGPNWPSDRLG